MQVSVRLMLMGLFWPFTMVDNFKVREVLLGRGPGGEIEKISTGSQKVGEMRARVTELRITVSPPHTEEGEEAQVTWSIGDFDDF